MTTMKNKTPEEEKLPIILDTDEKLNIAEIDENVKSLIATFVLSYNYWGYLFSRIRRRPVRGLPSIMGVNPEPDGTITLLYNPYLYSKSEDKHILKVIEHEGMHLLNQHLPRLLRILANEPIEYNKGVKARIWNIAADCSVNVQAKIEQPIIIDGRPWPPQLPEMHNLPRGHITEWYYNKILENIKGISLGGGSGDSDDKGSPAFDDHSGWMKTKGVADISSLSRKVENHIQELIKESAKAFTKDRGKLPGHIAELIQQALKPPSAPYYEIIKKLVKGTRLTKWKRHYSKINRKRVYSAYLPLYGFQQFSPFPGKFRDLTFSIVILIDTSGSMDVDSMSEGLSGIKSIIEKDRYCHTVVLEVDTIVEKEYTVKRVGDIQFDVKGRGGTTLFPGLERARELECDVCLAFTDGGCEDVNRINRKLLPKKIIWAITPRGTPDQVNRTGPVIRLPVLDK
jgi:predicted metal-dependent peptidase